jgi:Anti-sigma factor NepR
MHSPTECRERVPQKMGTGFAKRTRSDKEPSIAWHGHRGRVSPVARGPSALADFGNAQACRVDCAAVRPRGRPARLGRPVAWPRSSAAVMSVQRHAGTAGPARATPLCFPNHASAWPSRRNRPRVCKTLPSDSYTVSFGTQSGPHRSLKPERGPIGSVANLNAGGFRACFISMSHDYTAIIPPRPGNNAGLHQPHRFHQQHTGRHQQQTIRARPTLTTAPEPTGRRGVGLGGEPPGQSVGKFSRRISVPCRRGKSREPDGTNARQAGLPQGGSVSRKSGNRFCEQDTLKQKADDSKKNHPAQGAMMPGNSHQMAGDGRRPASSAIGRCLAGMYDSFLRDPLPERLASLLEEIDRAERPGGFRMDRDRPSA